MPIKSKDFVKALRKKGFRKEEGGSHSKFHYYHDGKKTGVFTIVSRGSGNSEIDNSLVSSIKHQLKLKKDEFMKFVECPLKKEDYQQILTEKGLIPGSETGD